MKRHRSYSKSGRSRHRHHPFDWHSLHLRRAPHRSPDGRILGVCSGLAEHFDLSVKGVRIVAVVLLICSGFWPVVALYLLAAVLMQPARRFSPFSDRRSFGAPEGEYESGGYRGQNDDPSGDEWDYRSERKSAVESLKRTFDRLNRRLQSLEDAVTAKEFDWDRRFRQS
jgi:phage shock protein C